METKPIKTRGTVAGEEHGLGAVGYPVTKELTPGKMGDASLVIVIRTLQLKARLHFPTLPSKLADLLLSTQDDTSLLSVPFSWAFLLALYVIEDAEVECLLPSLDSV